MKETKKIWKRNDYSGFILQSTKYCESKRSSDANRFPFILSQMLTIIKTATRKEERDGVWVKILLKIGRYFVYEVDLLRCVKQNAPYGVVRFLQEENWNKILKTLVVFTP